MDKIRLENILHGFNGNFYDLYKKINVIDKKNTNFDPTYYNELVYSCMFLYHLNFGIESLSKNGNVPKLFDKVDSYEEFKLLLNEYKKIEFHNKLLPGETNMFQEVWRLAEYKILSKDAWTKVYSSSIYKKDVNEDGKLYISIDNRHLYQFACLLLTKCLKAKLNDFEFKVNNEPSINRRDNVVIYFTKDNLNKYLMVINQLLEECPNIQINESHILGYELENGVVVAKDYEDGSSFTEKVCDSIITLKIDGYDDGDIIELLEETTNKHLMDILKLINQQPRIKK